MATPPKPPTLKTSQAQEHAPQAVGPMQDTNPPTNPPQGASPSTGSYLTDLQIETLLKDIAHHRVAVLDGLSHVEAWDIRAHLNRIFGFARWSGDVVSVDRLYAHATETKAGKSAVKVAYCCRYILTVNAPDGTVLATYTEAAVGESVMPDYKEGDAHDMAIKTAESQALKRCAANLGTQFGLSLYSNGQHGDVVQRTLVRPGS